MLALDVLLDVTCCTCGQNLSVAVRCEGDGLLSGCDAKALAQLACPYCNQPNHVIFAPETGEVIDVLRYLQVIGLPEPSLN